jgi:hypothetical protein
MALNRPLMKVIPRFSVGIFKWASRSAIVLPSGRSICKLAKLSAFVAPP